MTFPHSAALKLLYIFSLCFCFLLVLSQGLVAAAENNSTTNIGAIIDINSRIGKEVKIAMEIAVGNFNNNLKNDYNLSLYLQYSGSDDFIEVAYTAQQLLEERQVQAIIMGMEAWQNSLIVAEIGAKAQVPILSLAEGAIRPPLISLRWPFLVPISSSVTQQIKCIAAIIQYYQWRKVIAIYEDDAYGGDSGILALLSEALQNIGSEIEYHLVLPHISSLSDPTVFIQEEMLKLQNKQSRVFIVIRASLLMAIHLFKAAQSMGLAGRESAWIMPSTVVDLLDSVNSSVISSMEGSLGIKTYYSETSMSYREFYIQFKKKFHLEYPEEDNANPGIYAFRAYDGITIITNAVEKHSTDNSKNFTSSVFLDHILTSNFSGLSGEISLNGGELSHSSVFRIVNVIGKSYKELDFWSVKVGFSENLVVEDGEKNSGIVDMISGPVTWPGNLNRVPKGWALPTNEKPMIIGVPGHTVLDKFVKVESIGDSKKNAYSGFCIALFLEVWKLLEQNYSLPYEFVPYYGSYDDLVYLVYNKTFDAVVGDVTIIANRTKYVDFSQPFAESGLTLIAPAKTEEKVWMFMKPFTTEMWVVTGAILIYTMFVVWFLEHRSNPAFRGPWRNQLGITIWFTFSSLFFAHREKIYSNFTRVVVVVWLFVVLVLTSSYTANLTSMLTVPRLKPNVTNIDSLKRDKLTVACENAFVRKYLVDVFNFDSANIRNINIDYKNPEDLFKNGSISAAFLELPYEKIFINQYCKMFTVTEPTYTFGGLGFVFQKGSPIAKDVSSAILTLSENGKLKDLKEFWFSPSAECASYDATSAQTDSLTLQSFWGLYSISCGISTLCFFLFLLHLLIDYKKHEEEQQGNLTPSGNSVWDRTIRLTKYFLNGKTKIDPMRSSTFGQTPGRDDWNSSSSEHGSPP